jgi:hypothetical protein
MMRAKIFVAALLSALVAWAGGYLSTSAAHAGWQGAQVKEVAGYRDWARINPELQLIKAPSEMG